LRLQPRAIPRAVPRLLSASLAPEMPPHDQTPPEVPLCRAGCESTSTKQKRCQEEKPNYPVDKADIGGCFC
jgi:hypothetical protein